MVSKPPTDKLSKRYTEARKRVLKSIQMEDLPPSWIVLLDEQWRIGRRRISEDETSTLYCSAEWHFARFNGDGSSLAPLIYSLAFRVADESGRFWASVPKLAKYFNAKEEPIREALHLLVLSGFFAVLSSEKGKPVAYRPVPHAEWAVAHPDFCVRKDEIPWSDGDPLGRALFAVADSRYQPYPNFLKGMRATGHSDAAIVEHWRTFLSSYKPEGRRWERITKPFLEFLRDQPVMTTPA